MVLAKVLGKDNVTSIRWFGPYEVHKIDEMQNYILKAPNGNLCLRRFPRSHLKKADMRIREARMAADRVVDARVVNGVLEYRIGFLGYGKDSDVWVREQQVKERFPNLLARFEMAKDKMMMADVQLQEGQKLSELLDAEDQAALDSAVAAPRMGVALSAEEDKEAERNEENSALPFLRSDAGEEDIGNIMEDTHQVSASLENAGTVNLHQVQQQRPQIKTTRSAQINTRQSNQDGPDSEMEDLEETWRRYHLNRHIMPPQTDEEERLMRLNPVTKARFEAYNQQRFAQKKRPNGRFIPRQNRQVDDDL